jgi:hypothetical protein
MKKNPRMEDRGYEHIATLSARYEPNARLVNNNDSSCL